MKTCLTTVACLALVAAALGAPSSAAAGQRLRDPFERPAAAPPRAAAGADADAKAAVAALTPSAPPWKPELRAIVFDHARSLVNISGVVLAIGESVHGYRLAGIDERGATLVKGGATIKLSLDKKEISQ